MINDTLVQLMIPNGMKLGLFVGLILVGFFLRLYVLGQVPISLHGDEVGVGYNAYTLLTQGKDEYNIPYPISFRADVTPLIFYMTVPGIAIFGLTDFAIRFPSAIIGVMTLIVFFWVSFEIGHLLFNTFTRKFAFLFAFISLLLLTISPWHIQISRIAHDGSYALLFQLIAIGLFLRSIQKNSNLLFFFSGTVFATSFYSYHSPRLTSPLLFFTLLFIFRDQLSARLKILLPTLIVAALIVMPVVLDLLSKPFAQTRIGGINILIGETIEPKLLISLPIKLLIQYKEQLNLSSLFVDSSLVRYFHVKNSGLINLGEIPFFLIGLLSLRKLRFVLPVLAICMIALLPGVFTQGPLNAGRIILFLPLWIWVSSMGITILIQHSKIKSKVVYPSMIIILTVFIFFLKHYFIDSPKQFFTQWQYGLRDAVLTVISKENIYQEIVFSDSLKQAYIYVLFYGQKSLTWTLAGNPHKNSFVGYNSFHNYAFRHIDWKKDLTTPSLLLVAPVTEVPDKIKPVAQIRNPKGEPIISLISTQ